MTFYRASQRPPCCSLRSCSKCVQAIKNANVLSPGATVHAVGGKEETLAAPALPRVPLSLPRRTRAFLAPRPLSAVAATTAAMFRSHPLTSPRCPPGIVVCVRGLPRAFRPAYPVETTFPRIPRGGTPRENYFSQETPEARTLACFPPPSGWRGWSQVGRGFADLTRPFPPYFPLIGGAARHPPRRLASRRVTLPAPSASRHRPLPPGRRGRSSASSRRARCSQDSPGGVWAQRSGINPAVVVAAWSPNRKAGPPLTPLRWRL